MNETLMRRVKQYLSDHKKRKHLIIGISALSMCIIMGVYSALLQPAISMEKRQIAVETDQPEGGYTDVLTIDVNAAAKVGQPETYFLLSASEQGAALSDTYSFEDDVELIDCGDGEEVELNRVIEGGKTSYWFSLEEGRVVAFSLDCELIQEEEEFEKDDMPKDTDAAQPEESSAAQPEESDAAQPEESSAAQPEESDAAQPEESSEAQPEESSEAQPEESSEAQPEESDAEQAEESSEAQPEESDAEQAEESSASQPEESADASDKEEFTKISASISRHRVTTVMLSDKSTASNADKAPENSGGNEADDSEQGKKRLTFRYTSGETLEGCQENLNQESASLILTWMSEADLEKLGEAIIEIEASEESIASGEETVIQVSAILDEASSQDRVFFLQMAGNGAGLSKGYKFKNGVTEIGNENGDSIRLHRRNQKSEGGACYWFTLEPGEEALFQLRCIDTLISDDAESSDKVTASSSNASEFFPDIEGLSAGHEEDLGGKLAVYAGSGKDKDDAGANARNRKPLRLSWEMNGTVTLTKTLPDGTSVTLTATREAFDYTAPLELSVRELTEEEVTAATALIEKEAQANQQTVESVEMWDIRVLSDGVEVQPSEPVTVTFGNLPDVQESTALFHVNESEETVENMNAVPDEAGQIVMETNHFSTYAKANLLAAGNANAPIKGKKVGWNKNNKKPEELSIETDGTKEYYYIMQYSDDESDWTDCSAESEKVTQDGSKIELTAQADAFDAIEIPGSHKRQFRIELYKKKGGTKSSITHSDSVSMKETLDSVKAGFSSWIDSDTSKDLVEEPTSLKGLYDAFAVYEALPTVTLVRGVIPGDIESIRLTVTVEPTGVNTTYCWEYLDDTAGAPGDWKEWMAPGNVPQFDLNTDELDAMDGKTVRCRVITGEVPSGVVSNEVIINFDGLYDGIVKEINEKLDLANYPIGAGEKGGNVTADLSIGGHQFKDLFYYGNVARDGDVDFKDADSYTKFLVKTYSESGIDAVREAWEYYLYDLYTPSYDLGGNNGGSGQRLYPGEAGYGDGAFDWPKDEKSGSATKPFHADVTPTVKDLTYDFLEDGVDYSNFVTGLNKASEGVASGDSNTDRLYNVKITADAQAKAVAPVALIFQIQTSWQMFDMAHANRTKPTDGTRDGTAVGACADNTELANLYDIKQALLRLVDYMETKYPGNNLVMGITDVEHAGTYSMFEGTDANGNPLYVTNDMEAIRKGIIGWDTFGNCEHVHYSSDALENAVKNLESNLDSWEDMYQKPIEYDDIQKVGVMIGGPTENTDGESGYGVVLPWATFRGGGKNSNGGGLNSVYGIRVNEGTPRNDDGLISWIDNEDNNTGTPFKDEAGTRFTDKYVAANEDAVFYALVDIVETEMNKKGIEIKNEDAFVEDVTVEDTIQPEFMLNEGAAITATIYNKDGVTVDPDVAVNPKTISLAGAIVTTDPDGNQITTTEDGSLTITRYTDKTTKLKYNFGNVYNTKKAVLDFQVKAREDYIGSNNVFTNIGTPDLTYSHTKAGSTVDYYDVACRDTPEVNVPIRFDVTNGDTATILIGDKVNIENLSNRIVEDAEYRADLYGQIDGTLTYRWELPGGGGQSASVIIKDGKVEDGNFPNRGYEFIGDEAGSYPGTLHVVFTPEDTNDSEREAVKELDQPGTVQINVVDGTSNVNLIVEKRWPDEPADSNGPDGIDSVSFQLLKTVDGMTEPAAPPGHEEGIWQLRKDEGWRTTISDLPASENGQVITYSVKEDPVPEGYIAGYEMDTQVDETYGAKITLSFIPKGNWDYKNTNDGAYISYRYGATTYQYTIPVGKYKDGEEAIFEVDGFELGTDGEVLDCEIVKIVKKKGNGELLKINSSNCSAEKVLTGSTQTPIYVITNTHEIELPNTGGPGKLPYTIAGCFFLGSAGFLYRKKIRRKEADTVS